MGKYAFLQKLQLFYYLCVILKIVRFNLYVFRRFIGLILGKGHGSSVMFSDGDHIGHISASKDVSLHIGVLFSPGVYNYILTLKALEYFYLNQKNNFFFFNFKIIINILVSQLFMLHLNMYVMGLQPF